MTNGHNIPCDTIIIHNGNACDADFAIITVARVVEVNEGNTFMTLRNLFFKNVYIYTYIIERSYDCDLTTLNRAFQHKTYLLYTTEK